MVEALTQRVLSELLPLAKAVALPELQESAESVAKALVPDFQRHERGVIYAIEVATHREQLVYWLGRYLKDPAVLPNLLEALGVMGYPAARIAQVVEMGEPRASL